MMCTSAHHGTIRGLPIQLIWVQSNVKILMPSPEDTPNSWFTGTLFGRIQQRKEKTERDWNRKPVGGIRWERAGKEKYTGEEEEKEAGAKDNHEETIARDPSRVLVVFCMQGV
jgi:hypothetical protein